MEPSVTSILQQISTELVTLFQGSLKIIASRHKCDNTFPKETMFTQLKMLNPLFFPL